MNENELLIQLDSQEEKQKFITWLLENYKEGSFDEVERSEPETELDYGKQSYIRIT